MLVGWASSAIINGKDEMLNKFLISLCTLFLPQIIIMKKYFLPIICMLVSFNLAAQNIDEILAKYETANGGKNAFASIKTLQYTSVVGMNMMGMPIDITMTNIFVMGKLYRRQTSGMMGMKGSYTLVTDTAGYTSTPTVPAFGDFPGMEGGIKKMDAATLQKLQPKLKSIDLS